jgi:glycosyltransferase involved in cell wall biosynthesis
MNIRRLAFISEDLSFPIDEGMKKFNFFLVQYIQANFPEFRFYSQIMWDQKIPYFMIKGKSLISLRLLRDIRAFRPELIVYSPLASGTFFSYLKLFLIGIAQPESKTLLINLQRRHHGFLSRLIIRQIKPDFVAVFSKPDFNYIKSIKIKLFFCKTGVDNLQFSQISDQKKSELRKKYGYEKEDRIILHVGHLNKGRNIKSLKSLVSEGNKVLIAGSTSTTADQALKQELIKTGIRIFDYYIENIEELYQLSDVYLFTVISNHSAIEFPLSVLEAMACNLPVITTPYGSLKDYFHESTCFRYYTHEEELPQLIESVLQAKCDNNSKIAGLFTWQSVFNELFNNIEANGFLFNRN